MRRLVIDSRYRKLGQEPDHFTVELPGPLEKVGHISLVASHVQFSAQTVSRGADEIEIDTGAGFKVVNLKSSSPPDPTALADLLSDALPPGMSAQVVNGSYGEHISVVSTTGAFSLKSNTSTSRVIGMRPYVNTGSGVNGPTASSNALQSKEDQGTHAVTLPYAPDLTAEPYLVLFSDIGGAIESPVCETDGALAIVAPGLVDVASQVPAKMGRRSMSRIELWLKRPGGQPYDFGGRDVRLEFELTPP